VAHELNKAYNQHREMTTEWGGGGKRGARLLANASWLNYVQAVGKAQSNIDTARNKFMANFDADVIKAKLALGDAAPARYPTAQQAGAAFQLHIDFIPIAKGSTPVGLPEGAPKWLAERYAEKTASNATTAMDAVIGRVREYTTVLLDNINQEKEFRSSSLDNITGLVPMLEAFSFTKDPRFAELAVEIDLRIGAYDLKSIKKEGKAAAKDVKAILDTMDAWAVEAGDGAEEEDEATEADAA
jgi:hypothetical protein